ncbi:MAG: amino acid permease [Pseudomonadota bacterium]|nr:amino acid permease [Pseudomonadota bacterium]
MTEAGPGAERGLDRALTLGPLILYGLGIIVGAGVYVALSAVMRRAGEAAPLSFLLAGVSAALTGLCYAELAARFPEASGAAAFVRHGFRSDLVSGAVALAITAATGVAAASIAHGAAMYLRPFEALDPTLVTALVIAVNTAIAIYGVKASVGLAAAIGALEIVGLLAVIVAGLHLAPDYGMEQVFPAKIAGWLGVFAGAFTAFFAFIGFETLVNLAEEVKDPTRTVPRGVIGAIAASTALYVMVALAVVLSDKAGANPLLGLFQGRVALTFATVGFVSIANGVLVEILMLSRLFYGMARAGRLPRALGRINGVTRTPVIATLAAGAIILAVALLAPFERLLAAANALTLSIFLVVDAALLLVKRRADAPTPAFCAPGWVPPAAILATLALLLAGAAG